MIEVRYAGAVVGRSAIVRELDTQGLFLGVTEPMPVGTVVTLRIGDQAVQAKDGAQAATPQEEKPFEAPKSWKAEAKQHRQTLPKDLQKLLIEREEEVHKGFTKQDEERVFGKQLRDVIGPYMPLIQAQGGTPVTAVQSLLNTAYILHTGAPEQKQQLFRQLAQQYGINIEGLAPQDQQWVDPQVQALQEKLSALENQQNQWLNSQQQHLVSEMQGHIQSMQSQTEKYPHMQAVSQHMSALIQSGIATGNTPSELLDNAYQQAVWANPELRSTLLAAQQAEQEAKRAAEAKAKADAARKAAGSIVGSPGATAPANQVPNRSLREELTANLRAAQGR